MNNPHLHNTLIFNKEVDTDFLNSMYEDDFPYIEEVFSITLSQLDPDLEGVKTAFGQQDLSALRKAVHKVKPSFGFVGLIRTQEQCRQFEDLCDQAGSFDDIREQYDKLLASLESSRDIIQSDLGKLTQFNSAL